WGWGHDLRARGPRRLLRARSPVDDRAPGVRAAPGGLRRVRTLGAGAGRPARPAGAGRPRRPGGPGRGRAGARDPAARAGPRRTTGRATAHAGHRRSRGRRGRRGRRRAAGGLRRTRRRHPLGVAVDDGLLRPGPARGPGDGAGRRGPRLDLTCTYAPTGYQGHLPRRVTYALFVRTRDGRTEQVGTWRSLEGRT